MASLLQSEAENSVRNFALMFGLESFKHNYPLQTNRR